MSVKALLEPIIGRYMKVRIMGEDCRSWNFFISSFEFCPHLPSLWTRHGHI
jgi:hypothetical protein